jgi:Uncharacterized conserved protein
MAKVISILIDGSNLYAAQKALALPAIDYNKIKTYFEGTIHRALYFTALPPKDEVSSLRPMVDFLEYNGWGVIQKEWKKFVDPVTKLEKIKGNMDVEITTMALEEAPHCTDMVLFTGDGDFRFLVDTLQRRFGVRVTVVSTIKTRPAMIADELRRQANVFIDLVDLSPHIKQTTKVGVSVDEQLKVRRFKFLEGK